MLETILIELFLSPVCGTQNGMMVCVPQTMVLAVLIVWAHLLKELK